MGRRQFAIVCAVLLFAASGLAQSDGGKTTAKTDPVSGTWSGELSTGERRMKISLDLKFDGKSAVTGTITGLPNPGDVKRGSFDTKTHALKLALGRADDSAVLMVFEGTVAGETATGRVSGDAGEGEFTLSRKAR